MEEKEEKGIETTMLLLLLLFFFFFLRLPNGDRLKPTRPNRNHRREKIHFALHRETETERGGKRQINAAAFGTYTVEVYFKIKQNP